jgi:hypothetical protein
MMPDPAPGLYRPSASASDPFFIDLGLAALLMEVGEPL